MNHRTLPALAALLMGVAAALAACGETGGSGDDGGSSVRSSHADTAVRPTARVDTLRVEGAPQQVSLRLFRAPDDFPLPFTAYVPDDMAPRTDVDGTVGFVAEFGGRRNEDAFLHVYVFPAGTDRQAALAEAKGYKTGRGIPVSQGIEILADERPRPSWDWAVEAYRFGYEREDRRFVGAIGVGRHGDRFFQVVTHYPAEYAEGFGPRAELILGTWRWADGSSLSPDSRGSGS